MRYRKTPLSRTLVNVWPANRRALERRAKTASELAHTVEDTLAKRSLFAIKHAALAALFEAAHGSPDPPIMGKPRASVDRRLLLQGCRVFSIRMRRGLSLHLPEVYASPLIVSLVNRKTTSTTQNVEAI